MVLLLMPLRAQTGLKSMMIEGLVRYARLKFMKAAH